MGLENGFRSYKWGILGILNVTEFLIEPVFWKKSSKKLIIISEDSDLKEQFLGP